MWKLALTRSHNPNPPMRRGFFENWTNPFYSWPYPTVGGHCPRGVSPHTNFWQPCYFGIRAGFVESYRQLVSCHSSEDLARSIQQLSWYWRPQSPFSSHHCILLRSTCFINHYTVSRYRLTHQLWTYIIPAFIHHNSIIGRQEKFYQKFS